MKDKNLEIAKFLFIYFCFLQNNGIYRIQTCKLSFVVMRKFL